MADLELLLDVAVINRGEELERLAGPEGSRKSLDKGVTWSVPWQLHPPATGGEGRFQRTGQDQP